jgi:U3 small nucleolar RNA-associated protein 14
MNIPEATRTGAAIVNTVIERQSLIPVSDDDDSSYITTSDEEDEEDKENNEATPGALKTVTLTGGGTTGLSSGDLASIITSISGSGQPSTDMQLTVQHISREGVSSSESESESDDGSHQDSEDAVTNKTNMSAGETVVDTTPSTDSLEGYDFTQYKVPELRAFVSQYQLAPNPTKLRKGELLDILIEAQAS